MRRVFRTADAPTGIPEKSARELAQVTAYFGPPRASSKAFPFAVYKADEIKLALHRLFRGKCAYCETFYANSHPMDVEHFRPKGAVKDDDEHPGYWWLAMAWDNLLPSCIDCNRKRNQITPNGDISQVALLETTLEFNNSMRVGAGKKDSFPLAEGGVRGRASGDRLADERALLLNPCEEEPDDHLRYVFSTDHSVSFVVPRELADDAEAFFRGDGGLSLKGATSIHVYGLNRIGLVQARTEVLRRLEFVGSLMVDLKSFGDELLPPPGSENGSDAEFRRRAHKVVNGFADRLLEEMRRMTKPGAPYSAMAKAWLCHFTDRVEQG